MKADDKSRILRLSSVLERTGLTRSTLYRKIELGTFPKQIKISERCVGWRETEIDGWLRNPIFYRRNTEKYDLLGLGIDDD